MSTLPYRFREKAFRRYENIIKTAVEVFPDSLTVNCSSYKLSPTTFSCRLRDAIRSLQSNNWQTDINVARLRDIEQNHGGLVVAEREAGLVLIGSKTSVRDRYDSPALQMKNENKEPPFVINAKTPRDAYIVALLAEAQLLKRPVCLRNVEQSLLETLKEAHDIGFDFDKPTGGFIIY